MEKQAFSVWLVGTNTCGPLEKIYTPWILPECNTDHSVYGIKLRHYMSPPMVLENKCRCEAHIACCAWVKALCLWTRGLEFSTTIHNCGIYRVVRLVMIHLSGTVNYLRFYFIYNSLS
jgi:hypothetical protein